MLSFSIPSQDYLNGVTVLVENSSGFFTLKSSDQEKLQKSYHIDSDDCIQWSYNNQKAWAKGRVELRLRRNSNWFNKTNEDINWTSFELLGNNTQEGTVRCNGFIEQNNVKAYLNLTYSWNISDERFKYVDEGGHLERKITLKPESFINESILIYNFYAIQVDNTSDNDNGTWYNKNNVRQSEDLVTMGNKSADETNLGCNLNYKCANGTYFEFTDRDSSVSAFGIIDPNGKTDNDTLKIFGGNFPQANLSIILRHNKTIEGNQTVSTEIWWDDPPLDIPAKGEKVNRKQNKTVDDFRNETGIAIDKEKSKEIKSISYNALENKHGSGIYSNELIVHKPMIDGKILTDIAELKEKNKFTYSTSFDGTAVEIKFDTPEIKKNDTGYSMFFNKTDESYKIGYRFLLPSETFTNRFRISSSDNITILDSSVASMRFGEMLFDFKEEEKNGYEISLEQNNPKIVYVYLTKNFTEYGKNINDEIIIDPTLVITANTTELCGEVTAYDKIIVNNSGTLQICSKDQSNNATGYANITLGYFGNFTLLGLSSIGGTGRGEFGRNGSTSTTVASTQGNNGNNGTEGTTSINPNGGGGSGCIRSATTTTCGGSGGAFGGNGGAGGLDAGTKGKGGFSYGSPYEEILRKGSGGGGQSGDLTSNVGDGGHGGAGIKIVAGAGGEILIRTGTGAVNLAGRDGEAGDATDDSGGGGGSGGHMIVRAGKIDIGLSTFNLAGGGGGSGDCDGGGGGGGRFLAIYNSLSNSTITWSYGGGLTGLGTALNCDATTDPGNSTDGTAGTNAFNLTHIDLLPTIKLLAPANLTINATTNTPSFYFNVTDDMFAQPRLNCTLQMSNATGTENFGTNHTVFNATKTYITANHSMANVNYTWWINCSDGNNFNWYENYFDRSNISETRNITINYVAPQTCGTLTSSIDLINDVSSNDICFNIGASNIYINCSGHTITYGVTGTGIGINNSGTNGDGYDDVEIRNCIIAKSGSTGTINRGINFMGVSRSKIINNSIYVSGAGTDYGIYLEFSEYLNIVNNTLDLVGTGSGKRNLYSNSGINHSTIDNNIINTSGSSNSIKTGIQTNQINTFKTSNNTITNNIIKVSGVTSSSFGIISRQNTSYNTIYNNNITLYPTSSTSIGISFNGISNYIDNNNIMISGGTTANYGIELNNPFFSDGHVTENSFVNNNITVNSKDRFAFWDSQGDLSINYLIYNNSFGEVKWIINGTGNFSANLTINITNNLGIGLDRNLFIKNNTFGFNSSAFNIGRINSTVNITFYGINATGISEIAMIHDYNLSINESIVKERGTKCLICHNISYVGNTLIFNATGLAIYSGNYTPPEVVAPDTNPPNVTNLAPTLNTVKEAGTSTMEVGANVSDPSSVGLVYANITYPNTSIIIYSLTNSLVNRWNMTFTIPQRQLGLYNISFIANDSSNNVNRTEYTNFTLVDTTKPNVTDKVPTLNSFIEFGDSLQISANGTDIVYTSKMFLNLTYPNSSVIPYELNNDTLGAPFKFNISFVPNLLGLYTANFSLNDSSNNFNKTEFTNFTVRDTLPPNVSTKTPSLNSIYEAGTIATIEIGVNVTDRVIVDSVFANITYPNQSTILFQLSNSTGHFQRFNLTFTMPLQTGLFNVSFKANDTSNNYNQTEFTNFTIVDTILPNVTQLVPSLNSFIEVGNDIDIGANFTDIMPISKAFANITYPNSSIILYELSNSTGNPDKFNFTFSSLQLGVYTVNFTGNDTSNNYNRTEFTNFTIRDTKAPNVTTLTPSLNSVFSIGQNIEVGINVTDITIVSMVYANVTYPNLSTILYELSNSTGHPKRFNMTFSIPQSVGLYNVSFKANDTSNNYNQTEFTNFTATDGTAPSFFQELQIPATPTTYAKNKVYLFNITIYETITLSNVTISFNWTNYTTPFIRNSTTWEFTQTDLQAGVYEYRWYANDTSANRNQTQTYTYTITQATGDLLFRLNDTAGDISFFYGGRVNASAVSENNTVSVFQNNTAITNNVFGSILAVGHYNFSGVAESNTNFTRTQTNRLVTVNIKRSTLNLSLNGNFNGIQVEAGTDVNMTSYLVEGEGNIHLYQNGTLLNNGTSPVTNTSTFRAVGHYNISGVQYGVQNFSGGMENHTLIVIDTIVPNVTNLRPILNSFYNTSQTFEIGANVTERGYISNVFANVSYPNGSTILYELSNSTGNPQRFNMTFQVPEALKGYYNITFIANDTSNNYNRTEFTNFTVNKIGCGTITQNTNLDQNVVTDGSCFTVTTANVYLNCSGYSIGGDRGTNDNGIDVQNTGVQILNCVVNDFFDGIYLNSGSGNGVVRNNTVYNNQLLGMIDVGVGNNTIENNFIHSNQEFGFRINGANNNTVTNNRVQNNTIGIQLIGTARENKLINNNITNESIFDILDETTDTQTNILVYNNTLGDIRWIDNGSMGYRHNLTLNVTNGDGIGLYRNILLSNNTVSMNSSAFFPSRINSTITVTLYGLNLTSVTEIVMLHNFNLSINESILRTSGQNCTRPQCSILSYSGNTLVFNVSGMGSFAGNDSTSVPATPDITPPNVTNLAPTLNSFVEAGTESIQVGANITDGTSISKAYSNITYPNASVILYELSNSTGNYNRFNFTFTLPQRQLGLYTINFTANDTSNNYNRTEKTNFTLRDTAVPNVTTLKPSLNSVYTTAQDIEIGANITDIVYLSLEFANVSYPNGSIILYSLSNSTNHPQRFNVTFTIPKILGYYNITFIANDTSNNYNRTEFTNFTVRDTIVPNVTNLKPLLNSVYNTGVDIEIGSNVTDDWLLSLIYVNITYPNQSTILFQLSNSTGNPQRFNMTFSIPQQIGLYNVSFIANDTSNNYNRTEFTNFTVTDAEAPRWYSEFATPTSPRTYIRNYNYLFNITWLDNIAVNGVAIYFNGTNTTVTHKNTTSWMFNISDLGVGTYNYQWFANDTSGNKNQTTGFTYTITQATGDLLFRLNDTAGDISFGYGGKVNASAFSENNSVAVFQNNTAITNNAFGSILAVGHYNFSGVAESNQNFTRIQTNRLVTVNQASTEVNLSLNNQDNGITIEVGTLVNHTGYLLSGSQGNIQLWRNGTLMNNGTSPITNTSTYNSLGHFNITVTYENTQNYSSSQENHTIIVTDATAPRINITFEIPTDSPQYVKNQVYYFNATILDNIGVNGVSIYFNGTNYTLSHNNGTDWMFNITDLGAGTYYYMWFANDTSGNKNQSGIYDYTITKAQGDIRLFMNGSESDAHFGYGGRINGSALSTNNTIQLLRNGTDITSFNNVFETLGVSHYNYTGIALGNQNYTASQISRLLNISQVPAEINLSLNAQFNGISVNQGTSVNRTGYYRQAQGNIQLYENGTLQNNGTTPITNTSIYNVAGHYNISVTFIGNQNLSSVMTNLTLIILSVADTVNPNVTNLIPTLNSVFTTQQSIEIGAWVNDSSPISTVYANITAPNSTIIQLTLSNSTGYPAKFNTSYLISIWAGVYNVLFFANDTSNNINSTERTNFTATDTTPPFSVVNLGNQTVTDTTIYWNWTNPSDVDFYQAILFLNGSNIANTSNNFYTASGLTAETWYNLSVNTKDVNGNINYTNISDTAFTNPTPVSPPSGGGGGGGVGGGVVQNVSYCPAGFVMKNGVCTYIFPEEKPKEEPKIEEEKPIIEQIEQLYNLTKENISENIQKRPYLRPILYMIIIALCLLFFGWAMEWGKKGDEEERSEEEVKREIDEEYK